MSDSSATSSPDARPKFSPITLGLFAILLADVWGYAAQTLGVTLQSGGIPVFIYASLGVSLGLSILCVTLAEFASAHPSTAGCTFLATHLSGPSWGPAMGFATGGLHTLGALLTPAALTISAAHVISTIANVMHPDWHHERWQIFLIYQCLVLLYGLMMGRASKFLNIVSNAGVFCTLALLVIIIGLLLGLRQPSNIDRAHFVWTDIANSTGWPNSLAVVIGLTGPLYAYGPVHWLLSMADEVESPRRTIPIAMIYQQVGNTIILTCFYIAAGYAVNNWGAIVASTYPSPIAAVLEQSLQSQGGVLAIMICLLVPLTLGKVSYIFVCVRLALGFIQTGAVPFSQPLTKVNPQTNIPTRLLWLSTLITSLIGLIYVASDIGFTIITSSCFLLYAMGYVPLLAGYLLTSGRYLDSPSSSNSGGAYFRLPRPISLLFAALSLAVVCLQCIVYCIPPAYPITMEGMNWSCVIGGVLAGLLVICWYAYGKARYVGVSSAFGEEAVEGREAWVGGGGEDGEGIVSEQKGA
ncbi:amino acid/polyamine transporter I [Aspergillus pseudoustus]|uniref:Amino acid/polyamine transporter I n=1 Tax=Aspergillus pseudoustus TaxID=1810923 RepID=A0ABR4IJC7_9EURO